MTGQAMIRFDTAVVLSVCLMFAGSAAAEEQCDRQCDGDTGCEADVLQCYITTNNARTAIERLKKLTADHPDNPAAARLLASAYVADGNRFWAERTLTNALEAHPGDCETRLWLAWIYFQGGDLPLASEQLDASGCPGSDAEIGQWHLLRYKIAKAEDDDSAASKHKSDFLLSEALYEEDNSVWRTWQREARPGWIPPLQLRMDLHGGYTSNASAGSPSETTGSGNSSGIGRFDIFGKGVLPFPRLARPSIEAGLKGHGLTDDAARKLSYLDMYVRPGIILGKEKARVFLAYRGNMLLIGLDGKERYYEAHRGEFEFETEFGTDFGLLVFGGAGRRIFAEMGRTRTEADAGVAGTFNLHPRFLLMAALSGRRYFAVGSAYNQMGGTALLAGRLRLPKDLKLRIGGTFSWDSYPDSGGERGLLAFGISDKREDLGVKQFDEIWSPMFHRMRFGVRYELSYRNSTADSTNADYDYLEHRVLAVFRVSLSMDPTAPKVVSDDAHVPFELGGRKDAAVESDEERIQDLLRQDEAARAGTACVD